MTRKRSYHARSLPIALSVILLAGTVVSHGGARAEAKPKLELETEAFGLVISSDNKYLVVSEKSEDLTRKVGDYVVRIYDIALGKELRMFRGHKDVIYGPAVSADGKYVATASGSVEVWDVRKLEHVAQVQCQERAAHSTFDPNGKWLAVGSESGACLYEVGSWKFVKAIKSDMGFVIAPKFSPDGALLAGGSAGGKVHDGSVHVWSVPDGKLVHQFKGHNNHWGQLAFAPDGKSLASVNRGDGMLRICNLVDGKEHAIDLSKRHKQRGFYGVEFLDEKRLLLANAEGLVFYDMATDKVHCFESGQLSPTQAFHVSKDKKLVAVGTGIKVTVYEVDKLLEQIPKK